MLSPQRAFFSRRGKCLQQESKSIGYRFDSFSFLQKRLRSLLIM